MRGSDQNYINIILIILKYPIGNKARIFVKLLLVVSDFLFKNLKIFYNYKQEN